MEKIISSIITFLFSTLSVFNVTDLPLNEDIVYSEKLELTDFNQIAMVENINIEDIQPEKVVSATTSTTTNSSNWWEYPDDIKTTTRSGNDLLVLVNKEYQLSSSYIPSDLVKVGESIIRRGDGYYLRSIIINDLRALVSNAKSDGIDLSIVSAYRSYSTQASTYQYWVNYNNGCVSCADRISARAGHSQHQLGTTLDFSSSEVNDELGIRFADTKASDWLVKNAYKYGFVIGFPQGYESVTGYSYEAWHYRYIGKSNASEMKSSGMILENYLQSKN